MQGFMTKDVLQYVEKTWEPILPDETSEVPSELSPSKMRIYSSLIELVYEIGNELPNGDIKDQAFGAVELVRDCCDLAFEKGEKDD